MDIVELLPPLRHRRRPKRTVIDTIVLHATAGSSLSGAIETLRKKRLGYHYLIEKNGRITKAAPVLSQVSHAGNSYGPREGAEGISREQGRGARYLAGTSVNAYSIGISFVNLNDGKDPFTSEQHEACRELIRALMRAIPSLKHLTTHYGVSNWRKTDPKGFDVLRLAEEVGLEPWKVPEARWPEFVRS